ARRGGSRTTRRPVGQTGNPATRANRAGHAGHTRLCRLLVDIGELHRPGSLLAGVDLEIAGPVIAARQAILGAADGEFLVARTHEGLPGPFTAAVIVDRVDVVVAGDQRAPEQRLAGTGRDVPPSLGGPPFGVLVAQR